MYLLSIPAKSDGPVIIVLKYNMPQLSVGNVLNYMPLQRKETTPLINLPKVHVFVEVHQPRHFSQPNKLPTTVYLLTFTTFQLSVT